MKPKITLTKHNDPGHGWVEIPRALIDHLAGVISQITGYSYFDRETGKLYLEEDLDAWTVIEELKKKFEVRIHDVHYEDDCFVRELRHWIPVR